MTESDSLCERSLRGLCHKRPKEIRGTGRLAGGGGETLMTEIRAFVGHSFTDDDAEVVRKFLTYFDQLSKSPMSFSWEHAEPAEPKVLADKVMSLLSDKNVFIGICTRKERVISSTSLKKTVFSPSVLKAQERDFAWKTSDWIIQEIGLALGKNLDLVLLMESGVRNPGGLQGDVEYISFDRAEPQKSFGKIVEMITALSPKTLSPSTTSADMRSMPAEEETERETPEDDRWATPLPEWGRLDYEFALFMMILREDTAAIAKIDQAYLATEDAMHGDSKNSWEAYGEYMRLSHGNGGSIAKLRALADAHPDSTGVLVYLGRGYKEYQDYAKAASAFEAAATKATGEAEELRLLGDAAVENARAELRTKALAIINEMKIRVEESGVGELQVLKTLSKLAEFQGEDEANLAILERIVEIDPSEVDTRFSLAYKHSEHENKDLALLHYLKIPNQQRNSLAWNNLGVAFDQLSLPAQSIDAYRTAERKGETLAMSNLANKFISAGFLPEAQKQCNNALEIEDYHKNIGHTLATLKGLPDKESNELKKILEKAKPKTDYYKEFGRAIARSEPSELAERWKGPDCVLDVTLHGGTFVAVGSYEQPSSDAFAAALRGDVGGTSSRSAWVRFRVEYRGFLSGRTIEAHVTRTREDEKPVRTAVLLSSTAKTKVLMFLTDDDSELRVMENPPENPRFYTLKRQAANA